MSRREVVKAALIFVPYGQEDDELAILRNQQCSQQYSNFIKLIGWNVKLDNHVGYVGGMDKTMSIDGCVTYYCNSSIEIIFHDLFRMPFDESDLKQIKKVLFCLILKKRHIGNDSVHIVWNEHFKDYKNCIRGDFGNALIVISPMTVNCNLYSIQIYKDDQVKFFGPLLHGMILHESALAPLVRATLINANRCASLILSHKGQWRHP